MVVGTSNRRVISIIVVSRIRESSAGRPDEDNVYKARNARALYRNERSSNEIIDRETEIL